MVEIYKSDGKQLKFAVIDKMLVINKQLKQLNKVMTDKFLPPGNAWKLTWLHYISTFHLIANVLLAYIISAFSPQGCGLQEILKKKRMTISTQLIL